MKKINDFLKENRDIKFLGILFLFGILGIGIMTIADDSSIFTFTKEETPVSNHDDLQKEIDAFKNKSNWNLSDYETVEVGITTSAEASFISGTAKGNLLIKLNNVLQDKTFKRCEAYLTSAKQDNPTELKDLLNKLQDLVSSPKINFYKTQIDKYNYYEKVLPSKINAFISDETIYNDYEYKNYKYLVTNMPGFENRYKNHSKFKKLSNEYEKKLDKFNYDFYYSAPVKQSYKIENNKE
jgi:hypothetical protein